MGLGRGGLGKAILDVSGGCTCRLAVELHCTSLQVLSCHEWIMNDRWTGGCRVS